MLANENMKLLNGIENMLDDVSIEQIKNFESNLLEIAEISKYFQKLSWHWKVKPTTRKY